MSLPEILTVGFWRDRIKARKDVRKAVVHQDPAVEAADIERNRLMLLKFVKAGDRVLDVGCGWGILCEMVPPGVKVLGIDLVPEFVEEARRSYPQHEFRVVDLTHPEALTDFADGEFDVACCRWIEKSVSDAMPENMWSEVLRRLCRVSRKVLQFNRGHTHPHVWEMVNGAPMQTEQGQEEPGDGRAAK